jgi:hypothetical protein
MTLKRFCDGCSAPISSGQVYVEIQVTDQTGMPIETKDWDMTCVKSGINDLLYGVSRGVYHKVHVRKAHG